jgi:hypothetical protein
MKVASANVLTLDPAHAARSYCTIGGPTMLSKASLLEGMADELGIDVIGIQEGREKTEREREGTH